MTYDNIPRNTDSPAAMAATDLANDLIGKALAGAVEMDIGSLPGADVTASVVGSVFVTLLESGIRLGLDPQHRAWSEAFVDNVRTQLVDNPENREKLIQAELITFVLRHPLE